MKTLIVTAAAMRQLNALPPHIRKQIRAKLDRFAQTGAGNVTVLQGAPGRGCAAETTASSFTCRVTPSS